jgi:hypothetical protein
MPFIDGKQWAMDRLVWIQIEVEEAFEASIE